MSAAYRDARPLIDNLKKFGVYPDRGFLPREDPLARIPQRTFAAWEEIGQTLPQLLAADSLRPMLAKLPLLDATKLGGNISRWRRAYQLLAYMAHAEVYGGRDPKPSISAGVAIPLCHVSHYLGLLPVLTYAPYALWNWRRIDTQKPVELGNIALIQNFLGGVDEAWFILIHVDIEAKSGPVLGAIPEGQAAVSGHDPQRLERVLCRMAAGLRSMNKTLARMPERCDPYMYYHRVRPYIHGWAHNPALPDGIVYEGITKWNGQPKKFYGETGAQSSIIPALDAFFGIQFSEDDLTIFEKEMLRYMPPRHRAFITAIGRGPSLRSLLLEFGHRYPALNSAYNKCVVEITEFRRQHLDYAKEYIHRQSQISLANPSAIGTGGSSFIRYLKKHLDETLAHRL